MTVIHESFSEFYPNPETFIPERFDPENGGVKSFLDRCVLIPFGGGPRICMGSRFVHMQVKAAIYEVVGNFEVSLEEPIPRKLAISPHKLLSVPDTNIMLKFKKVQ